ncbi:MAG: sodium-dependent transporter, partial [Calditrichae bacterium]|nr:sodium-dependent transporter [Calditrichia bacterium]
MDKVEQFSSRWALLLATIGMAIGAGNIWRFPRLAGQYGGAFLVPWVIFLILWSIPLLMVEFSLGKETRKGPVGAFAAFLGKNYTWMGAFVAICTMAIM